MLQFTDAAVQKILEFQKAAPSAAGQCFRIGVESGGCSGLTYQYAFDVKRDGDTELHLQNVHIVIDAQSVPFLQGSVLDYVEDFQQSGFVVQNPNSTASCGCGKSFGV